MSRILRGTDVTEAGVIIGCVIRHCRMSRGVSLQQRERCSDPDSLSFLPSPHFLLPTGDDSHVNGQDFSLVPRHRQFYRCDSLNLLPPACTKHSDSN